MMIDGLNNFQICSTSAAWQLRWRGRAVPDGYMLAIFFLMSLRRTSSQNLTGTGTVRTSVRLFYIVTRVVFIHVILLTEWFPMGHGCRMHTDRFPFSSVLLFLQYLNLCCKAFQSLYHKPLCRGLGLNPRALRWWEKRLDLSPREVRYFSQILECYLPLHYSPKSFYCVLCRRISQWAGASATVNAALPSEVLMNVFRGQTNTMMFPFTSTSRRGHQM